MSYDLPQSWAELEARLARSLVSDEEADEWLRQALESKWGVTEPGDLPRATRPVAFQKLCGAVLAVEESYEEFVPGQRRVVAACFARFLDGLALPGPPWRCDPTEDDRLPLDAWTEQMRVFL